MSGSYYLKFNQKSAIFKNKMERLQLGFLIHKILEARLPRYRNIKPRIKLSTV